MKETPPTPPTLRSDRIVDELRREWDVIEKARLNGECSNDRLIHIADEVEAAIFVWSDR